MSIAANLFFSSNSEKETLHRRVSPSDEQRTAQTERWNELADFLCDWLTEETGFQAHTWIQGSYKFGTQIRPASSDEEFDIDLGVYVKWSEPQNIVKSAKGLKALVREGIQEYVSAAEGVKELVTPPKERCERLSYDESFHIDVPSYHLNSKQDIRKLATETNGWESSDPKALVIWFRENAGNDDDRTQLRRMVRYLKMWAALKFKLESRPSSIMLTVLATDAFAQIPESLDEDDDVFCDLVRLILERFTMNCEVINPVDISENLNRLKPIDSDDFAKRLKELSGIAGRAVSAKSKLESSAIWAEAFEHFFPIPEEQEIREESNVKKSMAIVAMAPLQIDVTAKPDNGSGRIYSGRNQIGPIPKDYHLEFHLVSQVPWSAKIQWTVRNTGSEASDVNDLGHKQISDGPIAIEHSAYNGTHYMDCLVTDNGRLYGFQRIPVRIEGLTPRKRKASLVKFLSKRR